MLEHIQRLRLLMNQIQIPMSGVVIYKLIKYCCPFQEALGNRPQMSVCISSKSSLLLYAPVFLLFVCFPFTHSIQTLRSDKSRESMIPSDISLWILCLEM